MVENIFRLAAIFLIIAIFPIKEYDFYILLRVAVFALAVTAVIISIRNKEEKYSKILIAVFVAIAFLFNPIIPIHASKGFWMLIDIGTAGLFWYFSTWLPTSKGFLPNLSEGKRDGVVYIGIGLFFSAFIIFNEKAFPVLILGIIYIIAGLKTLIWQKKIE